MIFLEFLANWRKEMLLYWFIEVHLSLNNQPNSIQISVLSILFMLSQLGFFSHFYLNEYIYKERKKKKSDKKANWTEGEISNL